MRLFFYATVMHFKLKLFEFAPTNNTVITHITTIPFS